MRPFLSINKTAVDASLASSLHHNNLRKKMGGALLHREIISIPLVQEILMAFEKVKFKRRVIR